MIISISFLIALLVVIGLLIFIKSSSSSTNSQNSVAYQTSEANEDKSVPSLPQKPHSVEDKLTKWKNIHHSFTEALIQEWESQGFTWAQTKEWIDIGDSPHDAPFLHWLINTKGGNYANPEWWLNYGNPVENPTEKEQLREEFHWISLHPDFKKQELVNIWKERDFTLSETRSELVLVLILVQFILLIG